MARKALLIGINKYDIPGADLRGCVNDCKNLRDALITHYGFSPGAIKTMTDGRASSSGIQSQITRFVTGGRSGDILLLHYSGHGSNVPDDNGDEADKRDEILCPADLDWKKPLRDDFLRKTFDRLRKGVSLTVITDCCHSGTITRAINPPDALRIERFLPSPWDLVATESGRRLRGTVAGELRGSSRAARKRSDVVAADIPEVLITGCRATQTSADAFIKGSYNGALTFYLAEAIRETRGALSYRELHERATRKLKREEFDQVPQLEGRQERLDRPFLSAVK